MTKTIAIVLAAAFLGGRVMGLIEWFFGDWNLTADSFWCRIGIHRWNPVLMKCEKCKLPDRLLDPKGYMEWKKL